MSVLIGFTGKPESGKSTAAKHLSEKHGLPWINVGDTIKDMMRGFYESCGLSNEEIGRRLFGDLKEQPDPYLNGKTPRYAMQTLGKEWRDLISPSLFVDRWAEKVINAGGSAVADGMRHSDEQTKFKELGGVLVHMVNPRKSQDIGGGHVAETLQLKPDVTILNDGDFEDLYDKVDNLVEDIDRRSSE